MELERLKRINSLFDFYGALLTNRQRRIMDFYYVEDFSLGEIADKYAISRQAVHDALKRAEGTLERYEGKLGLADRYCQEKQGINKALDALDEIRGIMGTISERETISKCEKLLDEIRGILTEVLNLNYR